jgi:hypothetical protein
MYTAGCVAKTDCLICFGGDVGCPRPGSSAERLVGIAWRRATPIKGTPRTRSQIASPDPERRLHLAIPPGPARVLEIAEYRMGSGPGYPFGWSARAKIMCSSCPGSEYCLAVQGLPGERTGIWAYAPTSGHWKHFPDADPALWNQVERTIKLMPEYSVEIPLWGPWQELDLSATLLSRLRRWQEFFDESFRWDSGWASSTARDRWASEAEAVEEELRREVGDRADVVVNLWPIQEVRGAPIARYTDQSYVSMYLIREQKSP